MPLERTETITRTIETELTETLKLSYRVDQFTVRRNGPDAGEIFGQTSVLDGLKVIDCFDWVVPASEVLAIAVPSGLYTRLQNTLYAFPQTTTKPT